MINTNNVFWVGESFRKTFRVKNVSLSKFNSPEAAWRFKFFNGRDITEIAHPSSEVNQINDGKDVEMIFDIPPNHFIQDMVGDIQYQVSLQDAGDQEPRYFTGLYIGKVQMPI